MTDDLTKILMTHLQIVREEVDLVMIHIFWCLVLQLGPLNTCHQLDLMTF